MVKLLTRFNYFNQSQTGVASADRVAEEMDDVSNVTIDLGSEIKNNSMRIKVKNNPIDVLSDGTIRHRWVDADGIVKFKAVKVRSGEIINDELIDVYATHTITDPTVSIEDSDFLIFTGIINKGKIIYKENKHEIELGCVDRNHIALDRLTIPQAFTLDDATPRNSPEIIQQIIRNASENDGSGVGAFNNTGGEVFGTGFLIDARLFSDVIISSGTSTSASSRKLIHAGGSPATFISDGVVKGDWIRNSTDETYAYVVSVDSETQLTITKDIMASGETYQISNGFIQDIRPDGTAFPDIAFTQLFKPVSESVGVLSQVGRTNSVPEADPDDATAIIIKRGARWFLDSKNRIHWYIPDNTPEHIMRVGQTVAISPDTITHKIIDSELTNEVVGEVNYIIFYAGEDMNGLQITGFKRAPFSGRPNVKDSLRKWPLIAREMKSADEKRSNIVKSTGDTYSYSAGYNPLDGGDTYAAWDIVRDTIPTTDGIYNTSFIAEAKRQAESKCDEIFQKTSNPRWSGKIQIRGEAIIVGDLVDFTSKSHGLLNVKMRVEQVTHSFSKENGWVTTIRVLEDEKEREK